MYRYDRDHLYGLGFSFGTIFKPLAAVAKAAVGVFKGGGTVTVTPPTFTPPRVDVQPTPYYSPPVAASAGMPSWVLPAAVVGAALFLTQRRGRRS